MKPPDIQVNGRYLHASLTGVQRYAREISGYLGERVNIVSPRGSLGRIRGNLWEQFTLPGKIPPNSVLWSPANSGPLRVRQQVVSLHDIAALEHPEWFHPAFAAWYGWLIPRLAQRVHTILTVSEFSKERIVSFLGLPATKVSVIPPGVGAHFRPIESGSVDEVRQKHGIAKRYFLWVGTLEPRKNLPCLLQAWTNVHLQFSDIELILVGAAGRSFRPMQLGPMPPGVRRLGAVDDADLPALYTGALALVLPSLYEGFGLPALEAMACGTAVIASPAAAVAGENSDNVLRVNPNDTTDIALAMQRIVEDDGLRGQLELRGMEHAAGFTWQRTAGQVYQALCQAADETGPDT